MYMQREYIWCWPTDEEEEKSEGKKRRGRRKRGTCKGAGITAHSTRVQGGPAASSQDADQITCEGIKMTRFLHSLYFDQ